MFTAQMARDLDASKWVHPRTGETRYYFPFQIWAAAIGLEINYYKSGNISSASINGDHISNIEAGRLRRSSVYWSKGTLKLTGEARQDRTMVFNRLSRLHALWAAAQISDTEPDEDTTVDGNLWCAVCPRCGARDDLFLDRIEAAFSMMDHRCS